MFLKHIFKWKKHFWKAFSLDSPLTYHSLSPPPMNLLLLLSLSNFRVSQALALPYSYLGEISSTFCCFYRFIIPKPLPIYRLPNFQICLPKCLSQYLYLDVPKTSHILQFQNWSQPPLKEQKPLLPNNILNSKSRNLSVSPDHSPFAIPIPQIKSTTN